MRCVVGQGLVEAAAVNGEDHLVVDLVAIGVQRIGVVGLAMGHQAVDDAVGGVLASFHRDLVQLKGLGLQGDITFLLPRRYGDFP